MEKTALLVIDLQVALVERAFERDAVIERVAALARQARAAGASVVFVQHEHPHYAPMRAGADGWRIVEGLVQDGDVTVRKEAADAFSGTRLREELDARGVTRLVVTGMQTEQCVNATCRVASSLGYGVVLVSDAHTTFDDELPADRIIAHHNRALAEAPHPERPIEVRPARDVTFA